MNGIQQTERYIREVPAEPIQMSLIAKRIQRSKARLEMGEQMGKALLQLCDAKQANCKPQGQFSSPKFRKSRGKCRTRSILLRKKIELLVQVQLQEEFPHELL